jgi:hypothetical protein
VGGPTAIDFVTIKMEEQGELKMSLENQMRYET